MATRTEYDLRPLSWIRVGWPSAGGLILAQGDRDVPKNLDLPTDEIVTLPSRIGDEELLYLHAEDSYESIDQMDVERKADREVTFDVRGGGTRSRRSQL
jgi:hypothetical protein